MYKFASILALGLLATACVPHDADETFYEEETEVTAGEWQRVQPANLQNKQVVVERPVQQRVETVQVRPVEVKTVEVQPPKQTWWQTHNHTAKVVAPTCPCADPNDPCTHCYEK